LERTFMSLPGTYYVGYRLWHRRVLRLARRLHAQRPFALVHHVSFCGYREPSDGWRLGVPFIWGPVGGVQPFPVRFLSQLDPASAAGELIRNVVNYCQLRFDWRVRRAMGAAAEVLAANSAVARELADAYGVRPTVQLETGVASIGAAPRVPRDPSEPLRILWAGRLRAWKGLPLLLRALAALPAECHYTLRVLGEGPCLRRWQRLVERLGLGANIQWVGWPEYSGQLPHYQWADVFAFTSLRDTSGTGLLEALAAGAPIIGLDHQGAADIMTDRCAVRIDASSPAAAIAGFSAAITRLANDADVLRSLSAGAIERAKDYDWDRQWARLQPIYQRVCRPVAISAPPTAVPPMKRRRWRALVSTGAAK